MKKLLLPMLVAFTIVFTISSCKKEEPKQLGESMNGAYTGYVSGDLKVIFPSIPNIDTTFESPSGLLPTSGSISSTTYDDSLALEISMNIDGTQIDISILGYINSETSFTVHEQIYNYLGSVPLLVSGTGTVSGDDATVDINIAEPDGSTDQMFGDLEFKGSK